MKIFPLLIYGLLLSLGPSLFAQDSCDHDCHVRLVRDVTEVIEDIHQWPSVGYRCPVSDPRPVDGHCHPDILVAATLHYAMKSNDLSYDDSPLRSAFRGQRLPVRARFLGIGDSIVEQWEARTMTVDIAQGRTAKFDFSIQGQDFHIENVELFSRNGESLQCSPRFFDIVNQRVAATVEMMKALTPEQRRGWYDFCAEFPSYEATANEFKNRRWRDDENKAYRGCPPGLPWKYTAAAALCGGTGSGQEGVPLFNRDILQNAPDLDLPEAFMFLFDGYGDFDSRRGYFEGAVNLRGDEPGEPVLGWTNANGLRFYSNTVDSMGIDGIERDQIQLHYHDGSGWNNTTDENSAAACHRDMQRWLDQIQGVIPGLVRPRTMAMGYSNGGAAALEFQRSVGREGNYTDLLLTIDPIPRAMGYTLRNVLPTDWLRERHPNTVRHINMFQDVDYGSAPPLKLRSQAVPGADSNIYLRPQNWNATTGERAHTRMLRDSYYLQQRVSCEMGNIIQLRYDACL